MTIKNIDSRCQRFSPSGFRLYVLVFLALVLSGCVIVPYPTKVESLPFDDELLSGIVPGETSRQAVTELLGKPDVEDPGSTIALYADARKVAGLFGAAGNTGGTRPVRTKHVLVVSYDENETVRFVDVFRHGLAGGGSEVCASSGICINPRIAKADDYYRIYDATFYDLPEKDAEAKSLAVLSDQCAVYVYLDTNFWATENVLIRSVGHAGSKVPLDESGFVLWIHEPSPTRIGGSVPGAWQAESTIELDCQAHQAYFIKAKLRWDWGEARNDLELTVENPDRGRAAIRKRRLVLGHK